MAYMTFELLREAGEEMLSMVDQHLYVIKLQGYEGCGLGFSNNGNVPMHEIATNSKRHTSNL